MKKKNRRREEHMHAKKKMPMAMTMMPFPLLELPSELCLHVLTRLPLKYLMKLRCVSKFFLYLTYNPTFITSYCSKSNPPPKDYFNFMDTTTKTPTPTPTTSLVVASSSNEWQWPWPWRFHMLFKGSNFIYIQKRHELIPFHCPKAPYDKPLIISNKGLVPNDKRLINSINGLVCFGGIDSLEIYNIFAGTNCYLVPQTFYPVVCDPVFVFGYDPISNDYKILRIEHYYSWSMYSFRTNSWKRMSLEWDYSTVYDNSERGCSVCINGVIYWPPGSREYPYHDKIVLFNLHKEKFGVIQLPKEDHLLLPTQYADIQLLSFRGCLAFAFIKKTSTTTTTTRKRMRSGGRGGGVGGGEGEGEKATSSSHGVVGQIWVELFTLTDLNLSKKIRKIYITLKKRSLWNRQSFVVPTPSTTKEEEIEIVSCCDEIFLGWFESNQLRLYNLHTKCMFNLPLSPPSHYYPKASFMEKKKEKDNPTYLDNLSFDFSLI